MDFATHLPISHCISRGGGGGGGGLRELQAHNESRCTTLRVDNHWTLSQLAYFTFLIVLFSYLNLPTIWGHSWWTLNYSKLPPFRFTSEGGHLPTADWDGAMPRIFHKVGHELKDWTMWAVRLRWLWRECEQFWHQRGMWANLHSWLKALEDRFLAISTTNSSMIMPCEAPFSPFTPKYAPLNIIIRFLSDCCQHLQCKSLKPIGLEIISNYFSQEVAAV